jgi:hypothetical protein|tara:strand:- start:279 stop:578 length:300 start_codon:yes stop_codon:yes gene_type:complete
MIKKFTIISFVFIFLVSCSIADNEGKKSYKAEDLSEEQIKNYNAKVEENRRIICRNEKSLGSNILERKCYTFGELEEREENDKDMLRNDQSKQVGTNSG